MINFTNELKTENVPQKHMLVEFTKFIVAMIRIKKTFKNTFTKQSMRIVLKKGKTVQNLLGVSTFPSILSGKNVCTFAATSSTFYQRR